MSDEQIMLEVSDLHKSYGNVKILNGISLTVDTGKTTALIGSSGSGKSTFLRCVGMLEPFDRGEVRLDGKLMVTGGAAQRSESKAESRRRAEFGFVFQQFNLFGHRTALENVMEGPVVVRKMNKSDARDLSVSLLKRVGVGHRIDAAVPQMSGGEQQRVAIARALAMQPKCLLLDEPTSALDPELVGEVLDVVAQLAKEGMTMVIVTHEMGFAFDVADDVVYMVAGQPHESGPARQVLANPQTPELKRFLRRFEYASVPTSTEGEAGTDE